MGFFGKLKFWKKEDDELDFDKLVEQDVKAPPLHQEFSDDQSLGLGEKSPFGEEHGFSPSTGWQPGMKQAAPAPSLSSLRQGGQEDKEFELLSSKLDTIKAMLSSMEQRLANVEQALGTEKKQRLW